MVGKIYNFAAGPAQLPAPVLKKAQAELMNWHSSGMSVMEMSHRGSLFQEIHAGAKEKLRSLLSVPSSHDILFMQGGATGQFSAVPLNLMGEGPAVYAVTGNFSGIAAREAAKYGKVLRAFDGGASRGREALLGHFHAVNRGKASNGLRIVEVFVLHQKSDGIPRLSAAEALEALPRGTHRKGRRLLLVKRAARHEVPPRLLERNAAADHVDDVGAVEQIRNEAVRNHGQAVPFGRKAPKRRRKL